MKTLTFTDQEADKLAVRAGLLLDGEGHTPRDPCAACFVAEALLEALARAGVELAERELRGEEKADELERGEQ